MPLLQEITNQGRVVGGHLTNGTVLSGGLGARGDLLVQLGFKRQRLNADTVRGWEDITSIDAAEGVESAIGQAAVGAILPGFVGKAAGAAVGAAMRRGRTVRVDWVDDRQSIIQLPEKLFAIISVLLREQQTAPLRQPEVETSGLGARADATEQLAKLASLHEQGILTDDEFTTKKTELLKRI